MSDKSSYDWFFKSYRPNSRKTIIPSTDKLSSSLKNQDTHFTEMPPALSLLKPVSSTDLTIPNRILETPAVFSTKVFVGGIPHNITEDDVINKFSQFGSLEVYWPEKQENESQNPPKGYVFVLFEDENSVQKLVDSCIKFKNNLYSCISSEGEDIRLIEIRPWYLSDLWYAEIEKNDINLRNAVFVGGLPRPIKAAELAMQMKYLYGGVCYASIDIEKDVNYPQNSGRVVFYSEKSHRAAIKDRFVNIWNGRIYKKVEVKPFVLPNQFCDRCKSCSSWDKKKKIGRFFCPNKACLQYYCNNCWLRVHSDPNKNTHKPVLRKGSEDSYHIIRFC